MTHQLGLLNFSQQIITDYGPVTVASTTKSGDDSGHTLKNDDAPAWPLTILWPADSKVGVIHGQYKRLADGTIEAVYNDVFELRNCLRFGCLAKGLDLDEILLNHKSKKG